jgi:phage-related protein
MRTFSDSINEDRLLAEQGANWAWLFYLTFPAGDHSSGRTIRWAKATETVDFGNDYDPYPFEISEQSEDDQGNISEVTISFLDLGIVAGELSGISLRDASARLYLVHWNGSAWETPAVIDQRFTVRSYTSDFKATAVRLGTENFLEQPCPKRTMSRTRCSFRYKGDACGYSGTLTTCDYSLDGENGCKAHNNQSKFGGFPSLPTLEV